MKPAVELFVEPLKAAGYHTMHIGRAIKVLEEQKILEDTVILS